jgi:hypothetical protein
MTDHTPQPHATPCEGTWQGEGTNHDAAPTARAKPSESSVPRGEWRHRQRLHPAQATGQYPARQSGSHRPTRVKASP